MMRVLLLVATLLIPAAGATHAQGCTPGDGFRTAEAGGVYLWVTADASRHANLGIWQESNGIAGLQRNDVVFDETCWGHYPADTEILTFYML